MSLPALILEMANLDEGMHDLVEGHRGAVSLDQANPLTH